MKTNFKEIGIVLVAIFGILLLYFVGNVITGHAIIYTCEFDEVTCIGNSIKVCDKNGIWEEFVECPEKTHCTRDSTRPLGYTCIRE